MIYLIGALRNPVLESVALALRLQGHEVFDDWRAAHPDADDMWRLYEMARGRSYAEALAAPFANAVFELDCWHLDQANAGVLVLSAGKSAFAELGYLRGLGKPVHVLMLEEPERWDFMLKFATEIHTTLPALLKALK